MYVRPRNRKLSIPRKIRKSKKPKIKPITIQIKNNDNDNNFPCIIICSVLLSIIIVYLIEILQ